MPSATRNSAFLPVFSASQGIKLMGVGTWLTVMYAKQAVRVHGSCAWEQASRVCQMGFSWNVFFSCIYITLLLLCLCAECCSSGRLPPETRPGL